MVQKCFKPLLNHKNAKKIISVFQSTGHEIRFVGGAVRDCLAKRSLHDIDMATPLEPQKVIRLLEKNGIKALPTGIAYGTVTAILDDEHIEITTLRKDVSTDGRRAVVSYSSDWFEDATRRDFTINAMSLTPDGHLFDPFEGSEDLEKGLVKFIGRPEKRIAEDALRIMRYFRFHALFGKGKPDKDAVNACLENRGMLDNLSAERVRQEVLKLLAADNAAQTWGIMLDNAILANVLPHAYDVKVLEKLIPLEVRYHRIDAMRRFIALYKPDMVVLSDISHRMSLTKKDMARLEFHKKGVIPPSLALEEMREVVPYLYRYGRSVTMDGLLIGMARSGYGVLRPAPGIDEKIDFIQNWQRPTFPLSGNDVMKAFGIKQGKELGEMLKLCETLWLDNSFEISKEEMLEWIHSRFFDDSENGEE